MMKMCVGVFFASLLLSAFPVRSALAGAGGKKPGSPRPAIVLAAFGTSEPGAVDSILNVKRRVEAAFPDYDVYIGFTSNIIRGIWHERAADADFRRENPGIPEEIYSVTNVFSALAAAQEKGFRPVLVQSLHVTDGEEFHDLKRLVETLAGYKTAKAWRTPFPAIGLGAPALGVGDGEERYLRRAAEALAGLVEDAKADDAALVLMAHGNEHLNQSVFRKFQELLHEKYGPWVYLGTVEAHPLVEDVVAMVKDSPAAPKKVLLAPLMVVAGDHARNDMAGDEDDSWASIFRAAGFAVDCRLEGLGSNASWADIYVEHLGEVAPHPDALGREPNYGGK